MVRFAVAFALVGAALLLAVRSAAPGDQPTPPAPADAGKRVPWDTSRVAGTPEPPPPLRAVRAFPKLKFNLPLYVTREPGTDRFFVVEQYGRIVTFLKDEAATKFDVFLQLKDASAYSMTFHPDYAKNRFVYVFSNGPDSAPRKKNRILRYHVPKAGPPRCDPKSETLIIEWESNGHNGGDLGFGPDGMLYLTAGDGTTDSDTDQTGQDLRDLCSGVIRINVDKPDPNRGYSVPPDNPFVKFKDARPELWAFGFRNPWRMSFDPPTGNLWVGDIGQDLWEMIHLVRKGGNYGWSVMEGAHPFQPLRKRGPGEFIAPVVEHHHSEGRSITGGFVYHGDRFKELRGLYVYGDYSTGTVWGFRYAGGKVTERKELARTTNQILGFGTDRAGEIYFVDHGAGTLHRLEPAPKEAPKHPFPRKLSETGLFLDTAAHKPHPALVPYEVNSALWSDGAIKERFIALPGLGQMTYREQGAWKFPEGAVLVKTFTLEAEPGNPKSRRRVETRLLHLLQNEWRGYSYVWNDAQTDAELVSAGGLDRDYAIKDPAAAEGMRKQTWRYPSRSECMVCHSRAAGFVLGPHTDQMNRPGPDGENQLASFARRGLLRVSRADHVAALEASARDLRTALRPVEPANRVARRLPPLAKLEDRAAAAWSKAVHPALARARTDPNPLPEPPKPPGLLPKLADPYDAALDVNVRARSYLHANCSHCHVEAGGGNAAINLHFNTPSAQMRAIDVPPLHDKFGIAQARLLAPGDPARSVIVHRVSKRGPGQMPPLGTSVVDEQAAKLLSEWVRQMKPAKKE